MQHPVRYIWLLAISLPMTVRAQVNPLDSLREVGRKTYGSDEPADLKLTIAQLIQIVLGFVGFAFLVLLIVGGIKWMLSGGNEKKIEEAKKLIVNATIGLVLIVIAYSVASFIVGGLQRAVRGDCLPPGISGPQPEGC